ncbi:MAG TPA: hypothetical protein DCX06_09680 [Opitutae bacterium]|nr:hypothetical protein [Opitutae bacterium]
MPPFSTTELTNDDYQKLDHPTSNLSNAELWHDRRSVSRLERSTLSDAALGDCLEIKKLQSHDSNQSKAHAFG